MDRIDETKFVWALVDSARTFLKPDAQIKLWVKIGAGDQESAVVDLILGFVRNDAELPAELAPSLSNWADGYRHSDREPDLRYLVSRVRVGERAPRFAPKTTDYRSNFYLD